MPLFDIRACSADGQLVEHIAKDLVKQGWWGRDPALTAVDFALSELATKSCPGGTLWEIEVWNDAPGNRHIFYLEISHEVTVDVHLRNINPERFAERELLLARLHQRREAKAKQLVQDDELDEIDEPQQGYPAPVSGMTTPTPKRKGRKR